MIWFHLYVWSMSIILKSFVFLMNIFYLISTLPKLALGELASMPLGGLIADDCHICMLPLLFINEGALQVILFFGFEFYFHTCSSSTFTNATFSWFIFTEARLGVLLYFFKQLLKDRNSPVRFIAARNADSGWKEFDILVVASPLLDSILFECCLICDPFS